MPSTCMKLRRRGCGLLRGRELPDRRPLRRRRERRGRHVHRLRRRGPALLWPPAASAAPARWASAERASRSRT
jgi:hypothetical protein